MRGESKAGPRNGAAFPAVTASSANPAAVTQAPDEQTHSAIYDLDANDPRGALIDRAGMAPEDLRQISRVMGALGQLREAEQELSLASRRYMQLNESDMRALHFLIVSSNRDVVATPSGIAHYLGISSAATTKLLDRLEAGGHILRSAHPTDRRALAISITPETRRAATETVGRIQAKRFYSAARLTREEREVVIRFLADMTAEITLQNESWAKAREL